ncbi:MAG: hypothetical protein A3F35_00450 [Candidatus Woykebacteria bacterium RIFCSPHIGHO2_12_FULL_45_10]|uniref:DUF3105 domain-containing protein n=1 Tax=Candidatus Woykebacteria bacterium RIFCSPHIGHO2_12_FULL_45_10 TaxID=1802603 RepID=A0A1G1WQ72_9BACT|nr:MAG: hypothetical protein A3F35_00450 [Candidatus Woykebacteria bacterium RIFCSPHIGHO2_12_FULL_45_10]
MGKKEKREEIRAELSKAQKAASQKDLLWKGAVVVVLLGAIAVLGWLFMNSKSTSAPSVKELGQQVCFKDDCVHDHIERGTPHAPYNTNPPSNGPHYPTTAGCKIYSDEVVDEAAIHSLEHGAVWITYKDKNDNQLKTSLEALVKELGASKILLSPRAKNDSKIALASWGRVLKLESFDKQKTTDYVKLYRNGTSAREPLATC